MIQRYFPETMNDMITSQGRPKLVLMRRGVLKVLYTHGFFAT
jgi:hypothetical protein